MDRTFPAFSTLRQASKIKERLNERTASSLNAWVSVASAREPGLVLHSNDLGGFGYHYGDGAQAGASGRTWAGGQVGGGTEGYYPAAYVDSLEVDGNYEDLSRKASFTLVAHTQTQANELIKHFLEPGYTVFLQWGWNTDGGNTGLIKNLGANISKIASFTNPKTADVTRQNCSWEYDNYVGFITGGDVQLDGNKWKINVQCFGFTELPTTLNVADSVYKDAEVITGGRGGEIFANTEVAANRDNGTGRFMMMFNELPSHKRTPFVKDKLFKDPYMTKRVNYINFDNAVYEGIANKSSFGVSKAFAGGWAAITKGALVGGAAGSVIPGLGTALGATVGGGIALVKQIWDNFKESVTVLSGTNGTSGQTGEAEIENGIKLIHEERFIRFGALIRIINAIGAKGYELKDGTIVSFEIDSKDVPISGFTRMFSTKKTHLFVPNPKTPLFSVIFALQNSTPQTDFSQDKDNTVSADGESVVFPQPNGLVYNVPHGGGAPAITRNANTWGYLDDLYVNFDFAMEIIKTKNLNIREALLQILNGMSSAAGSIWDFQLVDSAVGNSKVIKTRIEDFNLTPSNDYTAASKFALSGPNCPFIDTSMDMDIPNEVANSVIGERNSDSAKINSSNVSQKGQAGTRIGDYILDKVESDKTDSGAGSSKTLVDNAPPATLTEEEQAIEQAKNYEKFMEKVGIYPKVNITVKSLETITDFEQLTYVGALDDLAVFESFKLEDDKGKVDKSGIGPLIAIHFTFTVHGVSGLRLGDTFSIDGLPGSYSENGFFQVIDVKHSISGMQWTTSIKGGWRPYRA